ncbi:MAG: hypothetical protein II200_05815 [Bacteroidaceae bacterium]|nr:hypothetical protein [Bacteroidaceae bacterium]
MLRTPQILLNSGVKPIREALRKLPDFLSESAFDFCHNFLPAASFAVCTKRPVSRVSDSKIEGKTVVPGRRSIFEIWISLKNVVSLHCRGEDHAVFSFFWPKKWQKQAQRLLKQGPMLLKFPPMLFFLPPMS